MDIDDLLGEDLSFLDDLPMDDNTDNIEGVPATNSIPQISSICKEEYPFTFNEDEQKDIDTPIYEIDIPDSTLCLSKFEKDIGIIVELENINRQKFIDFCDDANVNFYRLFILLYDLHIIDIWERKNNGHRSPYSLHTLSSDDTLGSIINAVLKAKETSFNKNLKLSPEYNVFSYSSDLTSYYKSIWNRIDVTEILKSKLGGTPSRDGIVQLAVDALTSSGSLILNMDAAYDISLYNTSLPQYDKAKMVKSVNDMIDTISLFSYMSYVNTAYDRLSEKLARIDICGHKLEIPEIDESFEDTNNLTDEDYKSFDHADIEDIGSLSYWRKYAGVLNKVSLTPTYWTNGIITPKGPQTAPIIWRPIAIIQSSDRLRVVFITINGMIVYPVVWNMDMVNKTGKPSEGTRSSLVNGVRGSNTTIKSKTSSNVSDDYYSDESDIEPVNTVKAKMAADDIPQYKRLVLSNTLFVAYLKSWGEAAKKIMGYV
jgi:hypothetical protein